MRLTKTLLILFHFPLWDENSDAASEMKRRQITSLCSSTLILLMASTLARSQPAKPSKGKNNFKVELNENSKAGNTKIVNQKIPGACFSKVPRLFGRTLGDIILFVSSKLRRLEARNFAVIFIFIPFTTYKKNSFTE